MIMVKWLAPPTIVVNIIGALLNVVTDDPMMLLFHVGGAGLSTYAWMLYREERMNHISGYRSLAVRLRWEIKEEGRLAGDRIESITELARRFATTRKTVTRALEILEQDGIIKRVQGRGTYIVGKDGATGRRTDYPRDRVEKALRDKLDDMPQGAAIPPVSAISAEHGVSDNTVRRMQMKLANAGLLRRTTNGRYVKK